MAPKLNKIYVVGFPKSGNTWLTRLLADILNCTPGNGMGGPDDLYVEPQSAREDGVASEYRVLKTHLLPGRQVLIDPVLERVVYIQRDFRSVVVSAFFYNSTTAEDDVELRPVTALMRQSPLKTVRYFRNRIRLWKSIQKLFTEWSDGVGGWHENYAQWQAFQQAQPQVKVAFITYEELLSDTEPVVTRVLAQLDIPMPESTRIKEAIQRQSFKETKKYLDSLPKDVEIPYGKDFNVRFLRQGTANDWQRFLSRRMLRRIDQLKRSRSAERADLPMSSG